jgi:hypothetical protein
LITAVNGGKDIKALQESLQAATKSLALAKQAEARAVAAKVQAVSDLSGADVQNSVLIQGAIAKLTAATAIIVQQRTETSSEIQAAKSNLLTINLTQAQIDLNNANIDKEDAQKEYDIASSALNAAVESGNNLKTALASEQKAAADLVAATRAFNAATDAYNTAQAGAVGDPNVAAILAAAYDLTMTTINAEKNTELLKNLNKQKEALLVLQGEYDTAYSIYLEAKAALQAATTNGNSTDTLQDAFYTAASNMCLLNSKVKVLEGLIRSLSVGLSISPEQTAIYSAEKAHQLLVKDAQISAAKAAAVGSQKRYLNSIEHSYNLAAEAYVIASKRLDNAISSGSNNIIQLRDASAAASVKRDNLKIKYDAAKTAYLASVADLDPIASFILKLDLLRQTNTAAQTKKTADLLAKNAAEAAVAKGLAIIDADTAALNIAKAAEAAALARVGGSIAQEMVNLRAATAAASAQLAEDQIKYGLLQKALLDAQAALQASTTAATASQDAFTTEGAALDDVMNGFIYSAVVDDYILMTKYVPETVTSGVPFTLKNRTITPMNMGVYLAGTSYDVGDIVAYPTATDSKYMCLTLNPISGKNPVVFAVAWVKVSEGVLVFNAETDLSLTRLAVTGTNNRIIRFTTPTGLDDPRISTSLLNSFAAFGTGIQTPDIVQTYVCDRVAGIVTISFGNYINQAVDATFYIKNGKTALDAALEAADGATRAAAEAAAAAAAASAIAGGTVANSLSIVAALYTSYNTVLGFATESRRQATIAGTTPAGNSATAAEAAAESVRLRLVAAQAAQAAQYTGNGFIALDISGGGGSRMMLFNKNLLPAIITPGNSFVLGNATIIPEASPTIYSNLVGYNADDTVYFTNGSVYMCIAGPTIQVNGTVTPSSITNKSPTANPELWVKIAETGDGVIGYDNIELGGSGIFLYVGQYGGTRFVNGFDTWTLSSFTIASNIKMAIFSQVNYGGLYRILTQSVEDFTTLTTCGSSWNNNVRSIKIMYATENIGKPYEAYVYNSVTDLAVSAESVYTDEDGKQRIRWLGGDEYNVYDILSLVGPWSLNNYILFGTGVEDNSIVYQTLSGLASDGTTSCYEFVIEGSISTDITKTFYIRNAKTEFHTIYTLMQTLSDLRNPPTQPSSLEYSSITNSGFTVNWSGGVGSTSYTYTIDGAEVTPSTDNVISKSATFNGLPPNDAYSLVITAVNSAGNTASNSLEVVKIISLANSGDNDCFVVKYNSDGTAKWARKMTGPSNDVATNIILDDSANVYVHGIYTSSWFIIFNADGSTFAELSNPEEVLNGFIVKYNSEGTPQWARKIRINQQINIFIDLQFNILLDASANLYTYGKYYGNSLTVYNANGSSFAEISNSGDFDNFIVKYNSGGTPQWVRKIGGNYTEDTITIVLDTSSNIYVYGNHSSDVLTIYNTDGVSSFADLSNSNSGFFDNFIVKYNSDGTPQWARKISGNFNDYPLNIMLDTSSNVYVSGVFDSIILTVYNANGSSFDDLSNSQGNSAFLLKYNSDGEPQWARKISGNSGGLALRFTILDVSANIYISGYSYSDPLIVYNPGGTSSFAEISNSGNVDIFIVKYSSDGTPQWLRKISGDMMDTPEFMALDTSSNLYISGVYYSNLLTIYNADGISSFADLSQAETYATFVVKYSSDGTPQWARKIGGNSGVLPVKMLLDTSSNVYIYGVFNSTILTIYNDNGSSSFAQLYKDSNQNIDNFIVKYNSEGTPQWVRKIGGNSSEQLVNMVFDTSLNVYVTGYFDSSILTVYNANGTSFADIINSNTNGTTDSFIVKYNSSGTPQWARKIAGNGNDQLLGVQLDNSANIYSVGIYNSTLLSIYNYLPTTEGGTPPSAITNLAWDNIGSDYFTVTWGGGDGATSYRYTLDGTEVNPSAVDSNLATFSGLTGGTTYILVVTAVNGSLTSSSSPLSLTTTGSSPTISPIIDLVYDNVTSNSFVIRWSGGDGATSYTYTLNDQPTTPFSDYLIGVGKNATFTELTAETTYTVVVTAVNGSLTISSSPITVNTSPDRTPPSAITNVSDINRTSSSFTITWTGGDGATSYTYTLNDQPATPSAVGSNSATFSGLNSDTSYSVVITGLANNGLTTSSDPYNCGTGADPPSPITGLTSSSITSSAFTVGWSGGDGATSYRYRLDGTEVIPSAENGVTSTASFDGLSSETSYSIVVIAIKSSSYGDLTTSSEPLTVTTISNLETPPSPITDVTSSSITYYGFTVTWAGGDGATSYSYSLTGNIGTPSTPSNDDGLNRSATFSDLEPNTEYTVLIQAIKPMEFGQGNLTTTSQSLTVTTAPLPVTPVSLVLGSGTNDVTHSSFLINWTGGVGGISYTFELNGVETTPSYTNIEEKQALFEGLSHGTIYEVKLTVANGTFTSTSEILYATTLTHEPPGAITDVTSSMVTSSGLIISWSGGDGATSYTYKFDGIAMTPSSDKGVLENSATFDGLNPETTYAVTITAENGTLSSSSSDYYITTLPESDIIWQGGHNVTVTLNKNIEKTGGVDGMEDAGQSSHNIFAGTKFLEFSVSSLLDATVGVGRFSAFAQNNYTVEPNQAFDFAIKLLSSGDIVIINGGAFNGVDIGKYNSTTVFGMAKDIVNNQIVFYINTIEAMRYDISMYDTMLESSNLTFINVSMKTSGGIINNIRLLNEKPETIPIVKPYSLTSSNVTSSEFTISWSGGDGATSYIYTIDGVIATPSVDNGLAEKSATFQELNPETTYTISVTAAIQIYNNESEPFIVTTISDQTAPSAITNLACDNISSDFFTVNWGGGDGATSYTYTLNGEEVTPSDDGGVASKIARFNGLASGTTYILVVTAVNGSLTTSSDPLSITTT